MSIEKEAVKPTVFNKAVKAWVLWDSGGAAFNAVATTFVFSVYLTSGGFGPTDNASVTLGHGMTIAGLAIALFAPITGQRADRRGRGTVCLGIFSMGVVALLYLSYFVVPDSNYRHIELFGGFINYEYIPSLLMGVSIIAVGSVLFEFASVNYNAMLSRISTPDTIGRVSGMGWSAGYFGGILLLMFLNFGFISEDNWFGFSSENGLGLRTAMLVAATWMLVLSLPVLFAIPGQKVPGADELPRESLLESYRKLFNSIRKLWRKTPQTLYFLLASAVFRDGLTGIFTFGGILAAGTFGFTAPEVIMFGVAANVVAGIATFSMGFLDDLIGPKRVMVIALVALSITTVAVFFLHSGGKPVFWTLGLFLCIWVGPAQSASRTFLARRIPEGLDGELFGLYATTGRVVTFLAPLAFSTAISIGKYFRGPEENTQYWGILGIALILVVGLIMLLPVKERSEDIELSARSSVVGK